MNRRRFLRAGLIGGASALLPAVPLLARRDARVALIADPQDQLTSTDPVRWALAGLEHALTGRGVFVRRMERLRDASGSDLCVLASDQTRVGDTLRQQGVPFANGPERLALLTARVSGRRVLLACGSDARGLSYAVSELTDRLSSATNPLDALEQQSPLVERPTNAVRSVMRQFTSQTFDMPWFTDREMWPAYLDLLASSRFNRLHLAFGLGYDSLQGVADSYCLFLYPFLIDVPGYAVRVTNLTDAERDRNLAMLKFVSEESVKRGLTFQLGVWMHGYELTNSPQARYLVEGLTPETHARYCRDALTAVLRACPGISAVALRIHGESGIKEGSYDFWQTVFDGVTRCGRSVEIDLHAKGLDHDMIGRALATGMPVNVSPKYWAEHLGMPYHQTTIRDLEMPRAGSVGRGLMTLSEGTLSFTRYGYADFLREDRKYTVRHRVFSGTQRLLLSADPRATAAYSRAFQFCGSTGMDLMEPLTCRGRRGTGIPGTRRSGYADDRLETRWDWEKFAIWYRTWGRLTYNADAGADVTTRALAPDPQMSRLTANLAQASRILPIVTTAHLPSAACDAYWPEIYWNQPIVAEPRPNPYGDTPLPKVFTHVSPIDPQIFSSLDEYATELISGERSGKYSPIEVASWLEALALAASRDLPGLDQASPSSRRLIVDIRIQAGLGRFFAAKFRAGVLFAIHDKTGDRSAIEAAVAQYRRARQAWVELSAVARDIYAADLSASDRMSERGQWSDRLAAIDQDIALMTTRLESSSATAVDPRVRIALDEALARRVDRPSTGVTHVPPLRFTPTAGLPLELAIDGKALPASVRCLYRHVNQAERFQSVAMERHGDRYRASIPGSYTDSPYSLQYYFAIARSDGGAFLYPGLGADRMGSPYFVVRRLPNGLP